MSTIDSKWWPEWTEGRPKRVERYKQFRGERTHLFVGFIKKFGKPTSKEGDAWPLPIEKHLIPLSQLIKVLEKDIDNQHPNFRCYATNQLTIIKMIKYCKDIINKK